MVENALYLSGEEIARRCGVYETAYVTVDRKFIVDMADLKRLRMTATEFVSGLDIEPVTKDEADRLIAENNYRTIIQMDEDEKRELEKQCSILFGKGESVQNPHSYISLYCNLMAFWDKFGMNYFDLLKLPEDVFSALKKVMNLDSMNKNLKNEEPPRPNPPARGRGGRHSINF